MTAYGRPARASRRVPIIVLAIVAIAAGVVAGRSHVEAVARPVGPVDAAQLAGRDAISTAWYCPGLPPTFPIADQTVTLTNFGASARVVVTVDVDGGAASPVSRTLTVPHDSVRTVNRATLGSKVQKLPNGPLIVEPFSPDVVVSAGLETGDALATVPCASTAAADWYFAAGTTVRGAAQWLVLDNPFAADARVDVTLRTDSGLQLLPSLTGLDVPGRSRLVIPMHDRAVRQARVAVQVHAVVGRVVAAQTLQFTRAAGTPGVATTVGAIAPASAWWFTGGDTRAGSTNVVAISNAGELDARVNVQVQAGAKVIVRPVVVTVPSGMVSWVQIGGCTGSGSSCLAVPTGTGFVLQVHSDDNAPIVAETLTRFNEARGTAQGTATSMGSTTPARRWLIPRTRATGRVSTSIALTDTGIDPAHVSVTILRGGHEDRPAALQRLTVAPGARVGVPLGSEPALRRIDAAVLVTSDVPIFAESTIYAERDATRAAGVPSR